MLRSLLKTLLDGVDDETIEYIGMFLFIGSILAFYFSENGLIQGLGIVTGYFILFACVISFLPKINDEELEKYLEQKTDKVNHKWKISKDELIAITLSSIITALINYTILFLILEGFKYLLELSVNVINLSMAVLAILLFEKMAEFIGLRFRIYSRSRLKLTDLKKSLQSKSLASTNNQQSR